jgi:hypothetical protein
MLVELCTRLGFQFTEKLGHNVTHARGCVSPCVGTDTALAAGVQAGDGRQIRARAQVGCGGRDRCLARELRLGGTPSALPRKTGRGELMHPCAQGSVIGGEEFPVDPAATEPPHITDPDAAASALEATQVRLQQLRPAATVLVPVPLPPPSQGPENSMSSHGTRHAAPARAAAPAPAASVPSDPVAAHMEALLDMALGPPPETRSHGVPGRDAGQDLRRLTHARTGGGMFSPSFKPKFDLSGMNAPGASCSCDGVLAVSDGGCAESAAEPVLRGVVICVSKKCEVCRSFSECCIARSDRRAAAATGGAAPPGHPARSRCARRF